MLMLNSLNWKKTRIFALEFLKLKEGIFEAEIPSIRNILIFLRMNKSQNFKPKGNLNIILPKVTWLIEELAPEPRCSGSWGLTFHVALSSPQSCLVYWVRGIHIFEGSEPALKIRMVREIWA